MQIVCKSHANRMQTSPQRAGRYTRPARGVVHILSRRDLPSFWFGPCHRLANESNLKSYRLVRLSAVSSLVCLCWSFFFLDCDRRSCFNRVLSRVFICFCCCFLFYSSGVSVDQTRWGFVFPCSFFLFASPGRWTLLSFLFLFFLKVMETNGWWRAFSRVRPSLVALRVQETSGGHFSTQLERRLRSRSRAEI